MNPGDRLLAIDPGLRHCGVATFIDNKLETAFLAKNSEANDRGPKAWREMGLAVLAGLQARNVFPIYSFIVECPEIYQAAFQLGDQDDIIQLACAAGAVAAQIPCTKAYAFKPKEWKGQVPKMIHNARVLRGLLPEEIEKVEETPRYFRHNVIDAIGLGLYVLRKQGVRISSARIQPRVPQLEYDSRGDLDDED